MYTKNELWNGTLYVYFIMYYKLMPEKFISEKNVTLLSF